MAKLKYLAVVEKGPASYGAYAPDIPGCGSTGDTPEEALKNLREALELYLESMVDAGETPPQPAHIAGEFVSVELDATSPSAAPWAS